LIDKCFFSTGQESEIYVPLHHLPKRLTDSVDSPKDCSIIEEKVESTEANKSEITVRSVSVDGVSIADSV
jgi:hypothetical protein